MPLNLHAREPVPVAGLDMAGIVIMQGDVWAGKLVVSAATAAAIAALLNNAEGLLAAAVELLAADNADNADDFDGYDWERLENAFTRLAEVVAACGLTIPAGPSASLGVANPQPGAES
jgi:hypothetical protein